MEALPATILVVEDHTATRRFLADNLAADGYEPLEAASVESGAAAGGGTGCRSGLPAGAAAWRAGVAVEEGVRAVEGAGGRADPCVHARGVASRGVGVQDDRADPHAGLARVPAAEEAQRRGRWVRGQRVGGGVQADGRRGRVIGSALALAGWPAA